MKHILNQFITKSVIAAVLIFSLFNNTTFAQKEADQKVDVTLRIIGIVNKDGQKFKDVTATLYSDNNKIKSLVTATDGKFSFDLDFQKNYIIEISKSGYISQKIKVNSHIPEKKLKGDSWWSVKPVINMLESHAGIDAVALNEPVISVEWVDKKDDFKIDETYSKTMAAKIDEVKGKVTELKKADVSKKIKEGDKLLAKKQYEEAWLLYSEAKKILPKDPTAAEKIAGVKNKIKDSPEQGYKKAMDKAEKDLAAKKYNAAKKSVEIALLYKENDSAAIAKLQSIENVQNGGSDLAGDGEDIEKPSPTQEKENILKIESYKKELRVFEKDNNRRSIAAILDSIGNLYRSNKTNDEAVKYYSQAVKVTEELGDKKNVAKILSKEAKVHMEMGNYENTLDCYEKALKITEELNQKDETANILGNMANLYNYTYRTDDALKAYEKLVDLKNDMGDQKGQSDALSNIGDIYLAKQDAQKAIENYEKSLKIDIGSKDIKGQATNYNNLGVAYHKKGDYKKSIQSHEKAQKIFEELNDKTGLFKTYNNLGNNYYKMNDFVKAEDYYNNTLKTAKAVSDEKGQISALYNLGNIFKDQKKYEKALENFNKSVELAKQIKYQEALGKNYKSMSAIYYDKKDFQKAYEHYKLYVDAKFIEDDEGQLSEIQAKVENDLQIEKLKAKLTAQTMLSMLKDEQNLKEIELRDVEIQRQEEVNQKQRILIFAFVLGFLIVIIFSFLLFRQYKQIKKSNKLLAQQNEEIRQQKEEITAQRDQLEEINIELEKLSIVARETSNAVIIMDGEGRFEWVNAGFERLFGITLEQLIQQKGDNFIDTSNSSDAKDLFLSCIENKITVSYDTFTFDAAGNKIWTQTTLTPIADASGKVIKLVAIDSNITQIKLAEEEIKQQNEEIKAQSEQLKEFNKKLETKNIQIMDSINYAKRIQEAILPRQSLIYTALPDSFILFKPKDIVSGDFYWYAQLGDKWFVAAVDCTGHGVPGAFMSMIGNTLLNEIVVNKKVDVPSAILLELNKGISFSLTQGKEGEDSQDDGMDISICCVDTVKKTATLALAGHAAFAVRDNTLSSVEGDIFSIGGMFANNPNIEFTDNVFPLDKPLTLYMFSDGYQDQFGGADNKKFMVNRFGKLLSENQNLPMCDQHVLLDKTIEEWKGSRKQLDDILVIGLRFPGV